MMGMYTIKSIKSIQMAIDLMHGVGRTSSRINDFVLKEMSNYIIR